ncbi:MAG: preprotein translocase subunit SecD [Acidimicrobiaceae bacterium]|nr:preprotein translocase subunit SecD [Acidimicrobiaceae bacterium]MDQ1365842.1 preprotein translocase subunit SecD [Acidimicrobiaceae bacterium]MDQ1378231.1 preprotein translocase subunit SecD [Acidimicrobiaceae bacterium]MDQ1420029.1 preprotein translocase subunit SecD [Acidimicrobiaceae bacterium]MDQ1441616.1 preprotein translocase subunit SecD [Acidimicrobiaceae bacterium]
MLQPKGKVDGGILNQAISIMRKRIDALGVAEPNISRQGNNVVVELPGIKDPARALQVVGQTAQLLFRPVLCTAGTGAGATPTLFQPFNASNTPGATTTTVPGATTTVPGATTTTKPGATTPSSGALGAGGGRVPASGLPISARPAAALPSQTPTTPPATAAPATTPPATTAPGATVPGTTPTTVAGAAGTAGASPYSANDCQLANTNVSSALPTTTRDQDVPTATVLLPAADQAGNADPNGPRYLLGPAQLTGKVVSTATALPPDLSISEPNWYVQVKFTGSGGPQFDKLAQDNYQMFVAIALDGVVESAPQIQQQSYSGTAVINGANFTEGTAKNLALELRYGSLPVQFEAQSIQTVSATIGKDSLRAGLVAGAIGLLLVLCYMLFYYRALGLVVVLGLTLSGMLLYSIISQLSVSRGLALSLAGATGIIVSVGVTADSYIVYFERLKDELRSGKSVRSSVDRGFSRAYRTIVAADLVSIMAALILYLFTVGSVRGFALTLGLSTALDLITAYFFTRPMVALLGRSRLFTEARFFGVARGLAAAPTGGPQ